MEMLKVYELFLKVENALYESLRTAIYTNVGPVQFCMNIHTGEMEVLQEGSFHDGKVGQVSGNVLILGKWQDYWKNIDFFDADCLTDMQIEEVKKILEYNSFCVPECPLLF